MATPGAALRTSDRPAGAAPVMRYVLLLGALALLAFGGGYAIRAVIDTEERVAPARAPTPPEPRLGAVTPLERSADAPRLATLERAVTLPRLRPAPRPVRRAAPPPPEPVATPTFEPTPEPQVYVPPAPAPEPAPAPPAPTPAPTFDSSG